MAFRAPLLPPAPFLPSLGSTSDLVRGKLGEIIADKCVKKSSAAFLYISQADLERHDLPVCNLLRELLEMPSLGVEDGAWPHWASALIGMFLACNACRSVIEPHLPECVCRAVEGAIFPQEVQMMVERDSRLFAHCGAAVGRALELGRTGSGEALRFVAWMVREVPSALPPAFGEYFAALLARAAGGEERAMPVLHVLELFSSVLDSLPDFVTHDVVGSLAAMLSLPLMGDARRHVWAALEGAAARFPPEVLRLIPPSGEEGAFGVVAACIRACPGTVVRLFLDSAMAGALHGALAGNGTAGEAIVAVAVCRELARAGGAGGRFLAESGCTALWARAVEERLIEGSDDRPLIAALLGEEIG